MTITFDKGFFVAHSIFDEAEQLKSAGFHWEQDRKKWITRDYHSAERLIEHCDSVAKFQIKFIKDDMQKAVLKSASADGSSIHIYHHPNVTPYPYQQSGVEYMLPRPAVLLADQMGLGKSLQAILVMNMRNPVEALIICPSILKYNWLKEVRKGMIGHITAYIYESKKIRYYKSQLTNHNKQTTLHIINYDILEKFSARLKNIPFNFFIADECFVYDTLIDTDMGKMKIGDVVENRLSVNILSYNHKTGQCEYNKISRLIKHEKQSKKMLKISLSNGKVITCTEDHKFYTGGKYKKISEIKSGDNLFVLRNESNEGQEREIDSEILLPKMCELLSQFPSSNKRKSVKAIQTAKEGNDMRTVQGDICMQGKKRREKEEILLDSLFCGMEDVPATNQGGSQGKTLVTERTNDSYCEEKTFRQSEFSLNVIQANEGKKSYEQSRDGRESEVEKQRKNIYIKGREWSDNCSSKEITGGIRFTRELSGVSDFAEKSTFFVPFGSRLLQSGYRDTRTKIGNRSGWEYSQNEEVEISGQEENRNLECVRVESIEILERASDEQYRSSESGNIKLYDIEVENNHNYFAEGILVSNCHKIKNQDAKRTKVAQELARQAKWKIFITGTPIYNKPKDLFVCLNLIDPEMFSSFNVFATKYCGAKKISVGKGKSVMKYDGATNVDELNTILRANYMVRRMAADVLKDLPEKIKDVIVLNESDLDGIVQKEQKALENSKVQEEKLKREAEELKELAKTNHAYELAYKEKVKNLREIKFKNFGEISRIRRELAVKKVPYVSDFVKDWLENNNDPQSKIVVFGHHTEVLETLYVNLKAFNPVIVTGKVSDNERQRAISLFKEKNDTRVFLASMGAAGTGVDGLQNNCNTVVFAELDWTPSLVDQAESRLQRIGQKNTVWVYHIVADGSIDSRIVRLMMEKEAVAKEILDYRPDELYDRLINDATVKKSHLPNLQKS